MQTVSQYPNLDQAIGVRNKLQSLGVPVYVSGCNHQGYSLLVASRFLSKAKQALNSTEVTQ